MDGDDLRAAPTPQFRAPGHTSGAAAASRIGPSSTPLSSSAGRGLVTEEGVTLKREGHWLHLPVLRLAGVCLVSSSEGSLGLSLRGCLWDPVLEFTKAFQSSEPGLGTGTLCDALYPARWHLFLQCDSWVQDTFRSVSAYALPLSLPVSVECPLPVSLSVRLSVCLSPSTSLCVCHSLLHWPLGLPLPPLSICLSLSSSYLSVSISMSLCQGISLSPPISRLFL